MVGNELGFLPMTKDYVVKSPTHLVGGDHLTALKIKGEVAHSLLNGGPNLTGIGLYVTQLITRYGNASAERNYCENE